MKNNFLLGTFFYWAQHAADGFLYLKYIKSFVLSKYLELFPRNVRHCDVFLQIKGDLLMQSNYVANGHNLDHSFPWNYPQNMSYFKVTKIVYVKDRSFKTDLNLNNAL